LWIWVDYVAAVRHPEPRKLDTYVA